MKIYNNLIINSNLLKTSLLLVYIHFFCLLSGQQKVGPDIYLIRFTDKNYNNYTLQNPGDFLGNRALERRTLQQIHLVENDLPVSKFYIDSIRSMGFEIINVSKWLNALSVRVLDTLQFNKLKNIRFINPYINKKQISNNTFQRPKTFKQKDTILSKTKNSSFDYGYSLSQISIHKGDFLHSKGFLGHGIIIAVFDGGFQNVKDFTSLQNLWFEQRVIQTRDFADKTGISFYSNTHGSNVLSVMAGISQGNIIGSAPQADYILVHTENSDYELSGLQYEYPVEEFDWVVAAEYADSIGADIISSSLGYTTFNDPSLDYSYNDMDGKTAISSNGAEIASSKGILVVSSAGNEGYSSWKYISAPADADNILSVGAVDIYGGRANFSSLGPTKDGRIKPDIVSVGKGTLIQSTQNGYNFANGTSFSAPIISGLSACLWQAAPNTTNLQIIDALKKSANQANMPDTVFGYGIPDFKKALYLLNPKIFPDSHKLICYPNPFKTDFTIEFGPLDESGSILQIHNLTGQIVFESLVETDNKFPNSIQISVLNKLSSGIYIVTLISGNMKLRSKITKY